MTRRPHEHAEQRLEAENLPQGVATQPAKNLAKPSSPRLIEKIHGKTMINEWALMQGAALCRGRLGLVVGLFGTGGLCELFAH